MRSVLALLVALLLAGCGDAPPPRQGTAQGAAAGAAARVDAAAKAVDQAGADVARLAGEAAAAEALAKSTGLQRDIDAAVAARVRAVAAEAVHVALVQQEVAARTVAEEAERRAAAERQAEQAAQDYRSWVRLCRLVGGAAIAAGILLAGLIAWAAKDLSAGRWPGAILVGTGAVVIALGPATAWLPWLAGLAAAAATLWWAVGHRLERRAKEAAHAAAIAGSRAIDAVERDGGDLAQSAKRALGDALAAAGLAEHVKQRRGQDRKWGAA